MNLSSPYYIWARVTAPPAYIRYHRLWRLAPLPPFIAFLATLRSGGLAKTRGWAFRAINAPLKVRGGLPIMAFGRRSMAGVEMVSSIRGGEA